MGPFIWLKSHPLFLFVSCSTPLDRKLQLADPLNWLYNIPTRGHYVTTTLLHWSLHLRFHTCVWIKMWIFTFKFLLFVYKNLIKFYTPPLKSCTEISDICLIILIIFISSVNEQCKRGKLHNSPLWWLLHNQFKVSEKTASWL